MITTADSKLCMYPFTDQKLAEGNILIVDDHQENIDVLEEFLAIEGYMNFASTRDPRQVSDLVKSFHPDLILLDLSMPYMSGLEVLDKLKEVVPANNFLPVLVLTADVCAKSKEDALSKGAHGVLSKPFHLVEVGLRIKNMLYTRFLQQFILQSKNPANPMLKPTIKLSQPNWQ